MAETTKYLDDIRSLEVLDSLTKKLDFSIPTIDFDDANLQIPAGLLSALQDAPQRVRKEAITRIDDGLYKASGSHTLEGTGQYIQIVLEGSRICNPENHTDQQSSKK